MRSTRSSDSSRKVSSRRSSIARPGGYGVEQGVDVEHAHERAAVEHRARASSGWPAASGSGSSPTPSTTSTPRPARRRSSSTTTILRHGRPRGSAEQPGQADDGRTSPCRWRIRHDVRARAGDRRRAGRCSATSRHPLHRDRVVLAADGDAHVRLHDPGSGRAPFRGRAPSGAARRCRPRAVLHREPVAGEHAAEVADEALDALGGLEPPLLLGRQLLHGAADLAERDGDLIGRRALLVGGAPARFELVAGGVHQLGDLLGLLRAALGREDRGVRARPGPA